MSPVRLAGAACRAGPNRPQETTWDQDGPTRPWKVEKTFRRVKSDKPIWFDHSVCGAGNNHVKVGKEYYFRSFDGQLMPTKKDQPPPDLRYFNARK